jgi:hypothetical protein
MVLHQGNVDPTAVLSARRQPARYTLDRSCMPFGTFRQCSIRIGAVDKFINKQLVDESIFIENHPDHSGAAFPERPRYSEGETCPQGQTRLDGLYITIFQQEMRHT